jgi:hypothetical protein
MTTDEAHDTDKKPMAILLPIQGGFHDLLARVSHQGISWFQGDEDESCGKKIYTGKTIFGKPGDPLNCVR